MTRRDDLAPPEVFEARGIAERRCRVAASEIEWVPPCALGRCTGDCRAAGVALADVMASIVTKASAPAIQRVVKRGGGGAHAREDLTTTAGAHGPIEPQHSRASIEQDTVSAATYVLAKMVRHADADLSYGNATGGFYSLGNGGYMKRGGFH